MKQNIPYLEEAFAGKDFDRTTGKIKRLLIGNSDTFSETYRGILAYCVGESITEKHDAVVSETLSFLEAKTAELSLEESLVQIHEILECISKKYSFNEKVFCILEKLLKRVRGYKTIGFHGKGTHTYSGHTIVTAVFQKLLVLRFHPRTYSSFVTLCKEVPPHKEVRGRVIKKILRNFSSISASEIPIAVYNILALAEKDQMKDVVGEIVTHFSEAERIYSREMSGGKKKKVLGESVTIVNLILSCKRDALTGGRIVSAIHEDPHGLTVFSAGLLVGLIEIPSQRKKLFWAVKRILKREEAARKAGWFEEVKGLFAEVLRLFKIDGESLFSCYVDFGFMLIGSSSANGREAEELGAFMLAHSYSEVAFVRVRIQEKMMGSVFKPRDGWRGCFLAAKYLFETQPSFVAMFCTESILSLGEEYGAEVGELALLIPQFEGHISQSKTTSLFILVRKGIAKECFLFRRAVEVGLSFLSRRFCESLREEAADLLSSAVGRAQKEFLMQRMIERKDSRDFDGIAEFFSESFLSYAKAVFGGMGGDTFVFARDVTRNTVEPVHMIVPLLSAFGNEKEVVQELERHFSSETPPEVFGHIEDSSARDLVAKTYWALLESLQRHSVVEETDVGYVLSLQRQKSSLGEQDWFVLGGKGLRCTQFCPEGLFGVLQHCYWVLANGGESARREEAVSLLRDTLFYVFTNAERIPHETLGKVFCAVGENGYARGLREAMVERTTLRESILFYQCGIGVRALKCFPQSVRRAHQKALGEKLVERLIETHDAVGCPAQHTQEGVLIVEFVSLLCEGQSSGGVQDFLLSVIENKSIRPGYFKAVSSSLVAGTDLAFQQKMARCVQGWYGTIKDRSKADRARREQIENADSCVAGGGLELSVRKRNAKTLLEELLSFAKKKAMSIRASLSRTEASLEERVEDLRRILAILIDIVSCKVSSELSHSVVDCVRCFLKTARLCVKRMCEKDCGDETEKLFLAIGCGLKRSFALFVSHSQKSSDVCGRRDGQIAETVFEMESIEEAILLFGRRAGKDLSHCFPENTLRDVHFAYDE
ncbi:MAG: uncharacterized protein A8A55_1207 [Amphiamblys sp. WSBS2006]|nr:MAG: uncharacterized protein A8A55_1207 [Amphiamblys sp. WSBS2006]